MSDEIKKQEVMDSLAEASKVFNQAMDEYQQMANSFYSGLEPEEQLWAFCAIVEKLCKGELEEGRSYRGILYDTFGWGPEAYATAQCAGFLNLHNSIYKYDDLVQLVQHVFKHLEVEVDEEKLKDAVAKHFY